MNRGFLRNERVVLAAIVLAAVAVRVAFLGVPRVVRWDEAAHQLIAHSLLAGRGFSELVGARDVQQGPLVSYLSLLGVALRWPVPWATAGSAYVLFGSLLPAALYGVGRELYGRRVGLTAALLVAVYPALVAGPLYWGTMTEPPYLFFIVCGLYCTWCAAVRLHRGDRFARVWGWGAAIGATLGLAYLTRPEALAYLAVMLLYVMGAGVIRLKERRQPGPPRWRSAVAAPAGVALISVALFLGVTSPYNIYIYRVTGSWAISGKQGLAADIAQSILKGDAAEVDRSGASLDSTGREIMWLSPEQFNRNPSASILADPQQFLWHVRRNVTELWQALFHRDLFSPWVVMLAGLGLFIRPWTRGRLARETLLLAMLAVLASLLAFFVISRLLVVAIPIALLWAALGVDHLAVWAETSVQQWAAGSPMADGGWQGSGAGARGRTERPAARGSRGARFARSLPLALTLAAFLWIGAELARHELPIQPFWRIDAAGWLAAHAPAGSPTMARDSEVALYAGLPMVAFPNAEWPQVLAYGRARGARYLVVEEPMIKDLRPQLTGLLDPGRPLPGITPLADLSAPDGTRTLIYAFEAGP